MRDNAAHGATGTAMTAAAFAGTERFDARRLLGSGGFGSVYEAFDRKRQAMVAVKVLRGAGAADLYRFKQEFRVVSGLSHRNLVTLYELIADDDRWLLSMELVEGTDLLSFVRGGKGRGRPAAPSTTPEGMTRDERRGSEGEDTRPRGPGLPLAASGFGRLAGALRQLAEGLAALHAAGVIHRDVKPANVLCTPAGRVVLLDFGISQETRGAPGPSTATIIGTPDYMSPEQASEAPLTAAADWYSVGVLLFEALTGQLPFSGTTLQVLKQKSAEDAPPVGRLCPQVPEALADLCGRLLAREPARRPADAEVVARLVALEAALADAGTDAGGDGPREGPGATPFVGREAQLAALSEAFVASREGRAVVALVHGSSGTGKSTLARKFLRHLAEREPDAVVLSGRCFEHEEVPFKALDGVIDALSRFLRHRQAGEAESLLPRDVHALARLFPVLLQAPSVAAAPKRKIADDLQVRQAGFGALRELLLRLSDRRPVVLYIDDLQWGDPDGIALLLEVLRPPDPPPLLLVAGYRSEEAGSSAALRLLREGLSGELGRSVSVRDVAVPELSSEDSQTLALALLPEGGKERAAAIAAEARGNAFYVAELCRFLSRGRQAAVPGLERVIHERVALLPEAARRLLVAVAVAGQPVSRVAAGLAAYGASPENDEPQAVARLRAERLVRVRHARGGEVGGGAEELLPYHDRVREAVVAALPERELANQHLRLAKALLAAGPVEAERLVFHFRRGGDPESAARQAAEASAAAHRALAFHQSARLCREALATGHLPAEERAVLEARLAEALSGAGRPKDAAEQFLALAERETPELALERRRQAALQLFGGGYVEEGRRVLRSLLSAARLRLPASTLGHLLSLVAYEALLLLRGHRFRARAAAEVAREDLLRIDTCNAVGFAGAADPILAADFVTRGLWFALKAGEPRRVAITLAAHGLVAKGFGFPRARVARMVSEARALAEQVGDPLAIVTALRIAGHVDHLDGKWRASSATLGKATEVLQSSCVEVTPQIGFLQQIRASNLRWMGALRELSEQVPPLLADAIENGKQVSEVVLRCNSAFLLALCDDDPARAEESVRVAEERLAGQAFNVQHAHALDARLMILLYEGRGPEAAALLAERWPALEASSMTRIEFFGVSWGFLSSVVALAAGGEPRRLRGTIGRLRRVRAPFATALGTLLDALVERRRGRPEAAARAMAEAEKRFVEADMQLHAAVARLRLGQWRGGADGEALEAAARGWMAAQGVKNPDRMAAMYAPV